MKVTAILKGTSDSYGRKTIVIRIANGKQRNFSTTQMKVKPSEFKNGKVISTHPQAATFNAILRKSILETETSLLENNTHNTFRNIDFFDYCNKCLIEWDRTKKQSTLNVYKIEARKIKSFSPTLLLHQITPEFLSKYQAYLYQIGNGTNTVWKSFKSLRTIIGKAYKEKLIKHYPFDLFEKPKYVDSKRNYLSREQVNAIMELSKNESMPKEVRTAATWFTISCFTGLRLSDISAFTKDKNVKNGRLVVYTIKTGELVSMPINEVLIPFLHII